MECFKCHSEISKEYEINDKIFCRKCFIEKSYGVSSIKIHYLDLVVRVAKNPVGCLRLNTILSVEKHMPYELYEHILPVNYFTKGDIRGSGIRRIVKLKQPSFETLSYFYSVDKSVTKEYFVNFSKVIEKFHKKGYYMGVLSFETVGIVDDQLKIVDCSYITDSLNEYNDELTELENIPEYTYSAPLNSLNLEPPNKKSDLESLIYLYALLMGSTRMRKMKNIPLDEAKRIKKSMLKNMNIPSSEGFYISNIFLDIIESTCMESL